MCLCGCGKGGSASGESEIKGDECQDEGFAGAEFHEDEAQGTEQAKIDISDVNLGYVAVSAVSDTPVKLRVSKDGVNYDYDVADDGTPCIFPLQCGDGFYSFTIVSRVSGTVYASLYSAECEVVMEDEFQPFLRPSEYAKYNADSECVRKAAELASGRADALGVVSAVFDYICASISYDKKKAAAAAGSSGYMPHPDKTLKSKKGICFDYASLTAAMLRSRGIPTKIVFGYVSPDNLYHAWNMFYTAETGWVSAGYDIKAGGWYRIDTTFSAAGAGDKFTGDGRNYTDVKYY